MNFYFWSASTRFGDLRSGVVEASNPHLALRKALEKANPHNDRESSFVVTKLERIE